ncbi:MAG: Flp pilus assembly protein CpaB [Nitrospira sp.]|nr:Flp pilus assembly protein CpaB [Nitrospira sp.]MCA9465676.1 Flp pilus assembly protein CpaB [Nitrospira sp.]
MGQKRPLVFLGVALGIALVTTFLVYQWLQGQRMVEVAAPEEVVIEGVEVAVAKADIPWGTLLTEDAIRMVPYPEDSVPQGHFTDPKSLKGRVILTNLKKHEAVLSSKLAPIDIKTGGVAAVMDPNKRAMAVKVNEIVGLPGFVQPGDRVDVMATFENPTGKKGQDDQITKVVLENTLVLATDTQMQRAKGDEAPAPVKVITLEVSLDEAEKLAMAENGGKLRLALRSPLNPDIKKTKGADFKSLMTSHQLVPPRPKGAKKNTIEVIKGTEQKTVKF